MWTRWHLPNVYHMKKNMERGGTRMPVPVASNVNDGVVFAVVGVADENSWRRYDEGTSKHAYAELYKPNIAGTYRGYLLLILAASKSHTV